MSLSWIIWSFSQVLCGTSDRPDSLLEQYPWFGNNAFLIHYADSLGLFSNSPPSKTAQKPYEVKAFIEKKVYESTCSACHRGVIEVEDLESGAYLLKVQNEKGVLYHKLLLHL